MNSTTEVKHATWAAGAAGSLHINDEGTGGMPGVFTHSFTGNTAHWKHQIEHLRIKRRVIAFDFRGHGKSDAPSDNDYSNESLADDIAAVTNYLELKRFVLVGHSMGGSAAIAYAGAHPTQVAGLVVAGTPGKSAPELSKPIIESLESAAYQKVMDDYMKQLLTNATMETASLVNSDLKKLSREALINITKAMFLYNPIPALNRYKGPKLIISATNEDNLPNALHHFVSGVPTIQIEGTSHWMQIDKPKEFNHALDDFLKMVDEA